MLGTKQVHIIGMRPGSLELGPREWSILEQADVLAGGKRLLAACALASTPERPIRPEKQVPIAGPLQDVIRRIGSTPHKRVVVLADGDPLFFGFGRRLVDELGQDRVVVHPNVTTVQMAAARMRIPWHDLPTISMHGRDDFTPLFAAISRAERVAVYTDNEHNPSEIARALLQRGAEGYKLTVFEDLDTPQERIRTLNLAEAWDESFSALNLVFVERSYPPEETIGLGVPDQHYMHENNLITKQAVRAAGLGMLRISPGNTVWDLGAGCGSVSIEASHLSTPGQVYAVEKNRRRAAMINENVRRFGAWLVEVLRGDAPACLDKLPDPDRVFIGGGLGADAEASKVLLDAATNRLKPGGRIVVHCILLESLLRIKSHVEGLGWSFGATQIMASNTTPLAGDLRFKAQNPVFILWAEKPL